MPQVSEYNIWADPEAARVVLNAGADAILVPLDVCEDNRAATGMMTRDDLYDLDEAATDNPVAAMITDVFPIYIDIWREFFALMGFPMSYFLTRFWQNPFIRYCQQNPEPLLQKARETEAREKREAKREAEQEAESERKQRRAEKKKARKHDS